MPAMRKNVSPSTLFYFPSQVRIHPQIRSQITRLQSKYSLDLDPHSGVTQPKFYHEQLKHSLLSKPSSTPLCVQNILGLASLNTDTPLSLWRFHYLLSPTAAMSLNLASPYTSPPWHGTHPVKVRQATPPPRARRCAASPALWRRGGAAAAFILISFLLAASPHQEPARRAMTTCTYSSPDRRRPNKCVKKCHFWEMC